MRETVDDDVLLRPGEEVAGRYVVEERIGAGGLAEVFRVRHVELGSAHALKVLRVLMPGLRRRLLIEGRVQAMLAHPHVVRVTDVLPVVIGGREGQGLLMELVDGPALDQYLAENGALPLSDALSLFSAVLSAVAHAHESGVLHRDLKPGNVLLAPVAGGYLPKVTDFGLAKVVADQLGSSTRVGAIMGTPGYMAPEQARDASSVDRRTDVFGLGSLLFELLAGRNAFAPDDGGPVPPLATAELNAPRLDALCDVPTEIADAVARALARDRDLRFPDCASFAAALGLPEPTVAPVRLGKSGPTMVPLAGAETVTLQPPEPGVSGRWAVVGIVGAVVSALAVAAALMGVFGSAIRWRSDRPAPSPVPAEVAPPPDPQPALAPVPAPAAGPTPLPATGPTPMPAPPPEVTEVAPEPLPAEVELVPEPVEPEPVVSVEPEPVRVAPVSPWDGPPVPVPAATVVLPPPSGKFRGRADGRAFDLVVTPVGDQLTAEAAFPVGTGSRLVALTGQYDALEGTVELKSDGWQFEGRWDGRTLEGRYTTGGDTRPWSASR